MRLFNRHNGKQGVEVKSAPAALDIAASRTGDKYFLHVANRNFAGTVETAFTVDGNAVTGGRVFEIAPENPRQEISPLNPKVFNPQEHQLAQSGTIKWRFPARSVSVVELECKPV